MRFRNPDLLASYRRAGKCDNCGAPFTLGCGAHLWAKGNGGSDVRCNLLWTAFSPFHGCRCHLTHHNGDGPTLYNFIEAVARREGTTAEAVTDVNLMLLQLPKHPPVSMIDLRLGELEGPSYELGVKTIKEIIREIGL